MASPPVVVAVPARLESARLPGKVMADIGGQPMLRRVLERCAQAKGVAAVVACTDSEIVQEAAEGWGYRALLTPQSCSSGSERLACVVDELVAAAGGQAFDQALGFDQNLAFDQTLVINVQGDQPLLDPAII